MRFIDRIFDAAVFCLIFFSPLAFGSVYPSTYRWVEAGCFGLFALWMLKSPTVAAAPRARGDASLARAVGIPLALLLALIAFQAIPLPPPVLRVVSPSTYRQYSRIYFGWPARAPGAELGSIRAGNVAAPRPQFGGVVVLPTETEVRQGAAVPFEPPIASGNGANASGASTERRQPDQPRSHPEQVPALYATQWRPLTIAWPLTTTTLLGALAVAALLLASALYPAGDGRDLRASVEFTRRTMVVVLATGLIIAVVGLIQWATWNGKILWLMVPMDWGAPNLAVLRACGPFVDPDHFAGYLAMIFPLMVSAAVFGGFPAHRNAALGVRIAAGFGAFLIFTAVALSQSRAGWIGLTVGTVFLFTFVHRRSGKAERSPADGTGWNPLRASLAILGVLAVLALIFVGGQGRQEAAGRVGTTVLQEDFRARFAVWVGSAPIVREFPLFGVGLGAWPEAFFRFQPAPRSDLIYNAAHNDYLELLVDVGILGIGLAGWLVFRIAARLRSALHEIAGRMLPALAAIVSGIIAMAVIEFFDFDLQVPANVVLLALLTGLALRMGEFSESSEAALEADAAPVEARSGTRTRRVACVAAAAGALALGAIAMTQTGEPYPYDIVPPESVTDARNLLLSYPYNPDTHRMMLGQFGDAMDFRARSREIETWQWLDPIDPRARDAYARDLLDNGNRAEALRQIDESVYVAPAVPSHGYLSPRILPWLPDDQKRAIEDGFKRAVDAGFNGAALALGEFYRTLGRSAERAALLSASAARESDPQKRAEYLRESANAYVAMGELKKAGDVFRRAIDADPGDSTSYTGLIAKVLVPYEEFDQVQNYIRAGIDHDVDACQLALSARGAASVGRPEITEQTLADALKIEPASYDCTMELGLLYLRDGRNGRAILMFDKATELRPNSAEAYMELATAAEKNYDFFKAEKAYDRAASLAPQNPDVVQRLAAFKRKLADAASDPGPVDAQVSVPAR